MNMVAPRAEQPPDIILHAREAEMRPAVRDYAYKIHTELRTLCAEIGVADMEDLVVQVEKNPRAFFPHRVTISRMEALVETLHALLEDPREYFLSVEKEFRDREAELRRILGEGHVISFDAIEGAFTLKNGTKALEISAEERERAMQSLVDKLAEPDIIEFIKRLESDQDEANKWMLVYRTSAAFKGGTPVSILGLRDVIDADSRQGANGKKLVYCSNANDRGWYREDREATEPDAWATRPVRSGWMFVTCTVVDGTINKKYADQTPILQEKAVSLGLEEGACRRRTPQEVLYDILVTFKANGVRLLRGDYDITEQKTSSGSFVGVGFFGEGGVSIDNCRLDDADVWIGACLSR